MFLLFALLDLSPALPYSAREKMVGNIGVRPAQTCTSKSGNTNPLRNTPTHGRTPTKAKEKDNPKKLNFRIFTHVH